MFIISATTVPPIYYITSTGRPENEKDAKPPWIEEDYEDHQIIVKHAQTTLQPFPTQATHRPQVIYENYNPKYNTYDKEPEPKSPIDVECGTEGSCLMQLSVLEKIHISQNSHQPNWAKIAKKS